MILRKPYAFLIKYFRFIHTVLLVLMIYLLYRTNVILNFFQEYISSDKIITGKDFTGELFNQWMFILPFIIIVALVILLGVMYYKKKPKVFYIYNILIMIALLVFYNIGYDMVGTLETQVIETRTLRLLRDLFSIVVLIQGLGLVLTFIRATGFDIKKFDFRRDLEELDITEEDAEEFEVEVEVETNVVKREFRKNLRFAKYVYIENKFIINILILVTFSVVCFIIYMNLTIYNKTINQNETFLTNDFTMSISNSYLTNQDYSGKKITDNYLLIVELDIKANYSGARLNTTKAELKIKDNTYYPVTKYNFNLIDLGVVYNGNDISNSEFQNKILVYEIPQELIEDKMIFNYLDNVETGINKLNPKYIKIKLEPNNLDSGNTNTLIDLNNVVKVNEEILNETNIYLTGFEIQERFKAGYKQCIKNVCYDLFEYLNPNYNTNYDKALLKINGIANVDKILTDRKIYNLYNIINYFGKIKYQVSGQTKYYNSLTKINPKKVVSDNNFYIEIPKEVMDSDKISLIIDVRDKSYEYIIK